jgi:hypothetical protein
MNNLQNTIKDMFEKDHKIKQELSMLNANGLEIDTNIEFIDDLFEVKLSKPRFTKSFLNSNNILNMPSISLSNFEIEIEDIFELEKPNKQVFRQSAINGGFKPDSDNFENIVEDIYQTTLKDIEQTGKNISDAFMITINLSLGFLEEAVEQFNNKIAIFVEDYNSNISKNKTIIQSTIDMFKRSSTKQKTLDFFKDRYFNLIQVKKLSLSKLEKNIDTIRYSPWFSFASVIAKIKLFIHNYELQKEQYNSMIRLQDQIYTELEEVINEAFENLILDQQQLLQNKNLDTDIEIDQNDLYKYTIPIYNQLLKKYNFEEI